MFKNYKWLSPKFKKTKAIIEPMFKMIDEKRKNLKVLDAGCGDGSVSELMIEKGYEVFGIDENEQALKEAKKRKIKVLKADLENKLPFRKNTFDVVFCLRVLEHIFNTERFLKECARILKPKGILVVTADNINSFVNRTRVLIGLYPLRVAPSENYPWERSSHPRFVDHVRCFNKGAFEEVLKRAGFSVEKVTSDFICFNFGEYNLPPWSEFLGKVFPGLGETLIAKATKKP